MSLPIVYKHNGLGFGNLVILLADCQDKCNLIHEDAFKYELGNCVHISHFEKVNYEIYGGMPILGANAPVIIGHGVSSAMAIKNMILQSRDMVKFDVCNKIKAAM